jgi:glycosyltransferase involved in cell wall biosynthesis
VRCLGTGQSMRWLLGLDAGVLYESGLEHGLCSWHYRLRCRSLSRTAEKSNCRNWFGEDIAGVKMPPVVSVVMSVYNGERFLRMAIDSVLAQTFRDWELIVIDDASTDSTPEILAEYRDPRIQVLRNETNRKQAVCSNRGIAAASGRYIARFDADDVSLPDRLGKQVAYLEAHPDVALVASAAHFIDEAGSRVDFRAGGLGCCAVNFLFTWYCPVIHSSVVFRTEAARPPNGYDDNPRYCFSEDYEFMSRIAFHGKVHVLAEPLVEYRIHPSSVSAKNLEDQLFQSDIIARANIKRATGFEVDDLAWQAWKRFRTTKPGVPVRFESDEVERLSVLIPGLIRGFKHDRGERCVLPWYWAKHALALAILPRGPIPVGARARFLVLAVKIATLKIIFH